LMRDRQVQVDIINFWAKLIIFSLEHIKNIRKFIFGIRNYMIEFVN
jgi:hypothetical protein